MWRVLIAWWIHDSADFVASYLIELAVCGEGLGLALCS